MSKKWYLGKTKKERYGTIENVYLDDFEWSCGWSGGYIGNRNFHAHFDGAFLDMPDIRGHVLGGFVTPWTTLNEWQKKENVSVINNGAALWENLDFFLDDAQYDAKTWWRIKDLFTQFYALKKAAEVFQYGGQMTNEGRTEGEINKEMAEKINKHIETVIIPEIRRVLDKGE